MRTFAVANQKGGVGKSTTAACLAAEFGLRGHKVLLVDGDSRRTATRIFTNPSRVTRSLADVLVPRDEDKAAPVKLADVTMRTAIEGLDLIPATVRLANYDRENPITVLRLRKFLRAAEGLYDYVFIDTPPNLSLLISAALAATDYVLVVVQAEPEAVEGISDLLRVVDEAREANEDLKVLGAVCTMYDGRNAVAPQIYDALKGQFPGHTFETRIDRQVRLSECPSVHKPIQLHAPRSRGSQQYAQLTDEILKLLPGREEKSK